MRGGIYESMLLQALPDLEPRLLGEHWIIEVLHKPECCALVDPSCRQTTGCDCAPQITFYRARDLRPVFRLTMGAGNKTFTLEENRGALH